MKVVGENVCCFSGHLELATRLFGDFLRCTSGFHATMSTFPVEMWQNLEGYRVLDNVWKAHNRISYSFGDTEAKVDWGILPPAAGITG